MPVGGALMKKHFEFRGRVVKQVSKLCLVSVHNFRIFIIHCIIVSVIPRKLCLSEKSVAQFNFFLTNVH